MEYLKLIRLKFTIFNRILKINSFFNFLFFYGLLFLILCLFHIVLFYFGQYEKVYITKIFLIPIFTIGFIFPNVKTLDKCRILIFFNDFNKDILDNFYRFKNYIIALLFIFYLLFPYDVDFIKTALFCYSLWVFIFLLMFILKIYVNIDMNIVKLLFSLILLINANLFVNFKLKNIADSFGIITYIICIVLIISISLYLLKLNKFKNSNKKQYILYFKDCKCFGYNFKYILRSGKFSYSLYMFYLNYFLFIFKQIESEALITLLLIVLITNFVFLYYTFDIDKNRMEFIFNRGYLKSLYSEKIRDLFKLKLLYLLCITPAIFYKFNLNSLKIILYLILNCILFDKTILFLITKNKNKFNKTIIYIGIFLIILIVIIFFKLKNLGTI